MFYCAHDQGNVHSGVIVLTYSCPRKFFALVLPKREVYTIVIYDRANQTIAFEHRKGLQCFAFAHNIRSLHIFFTRQ